MFTVVFCGVVTASGFAAIIVLAFGTVIVTVVVAQFVASVLSQILYVNVSVPEKPAFGL